MYVETVPNRKSRPAVLLREAWREGKKIRKKTIANLTEWPPQKVAALKRVLRGEVGKSSADAFAVEQSLPHGHVEAVLRVLRKSGLEDALGARHSREKDLVVAMVAQRVLEPCSKLDTAGRLSKTTLSSELGLGPTDENDLYRAMDWLLKRQGRIEKNLAARHLGEGGMVLYDVSSSYYEGHSCALAHRGHDRDGSKGRPIIVYGLMTNAEGCPVALQVYPGNTGDPTTVPDQVGKLKEGFGLEKVILVGDRGMLTEAQLKNVREHPGLGWLSALRTEAIRKLVDDGKVHRSLFDERNLAELTSPAYPGERLIACFNPFLAEERSRKRAELLNCTEALLEKIRREVTRRTHKPLSTAEIGQKVGRVINRYKMAKHFHVEIERGTLSFSRREENIKREMELDGIYVVRTSEPAGRLCAADCVRGYKGLARAERAFRTLKGLDLLVRPIFHHEDDRVRAHIFLCMLAYYVEWHMRKALAPLLFDDEELDADRKERDPVAPAVPSLSARKKKTTHRTPEGLPVQPFRSLMADLGTLCRNRCRFGEGPDAQILYRTTDPTPLQARAAELLGLYPVA